tara:strand:- start:3492 stop:5792 length:2301 start_codon:yes stop_codon:yes gene_type:complete
MGGAGGHMWHPFDCPDVNSGQDLINFFQRSIESIKRNPAALKIDGVNLSFRLKENPGAPSGYEFVIDRGSMKPLDVEGVTAANADQRFITRDGSPHGMVEATRILLDIFNAAVPEILPELEQLGMTQNTGPFSLYFNTEFVLKKINVKEYPFNFIAIHGVNKFVQKGPKSRKGVAVKADQGILDQIKDKVQNFANKRDFKVYTSIPAAVKNEVLLQDALNDQFTIVYKSFAQDPEEPEELGAGEGSTKPLKAWLLDVNENPVNKKVNISSRMREIYPNMGKSQTPYAKNIYLEVLKGTAISDIAEGPQDIEAIVDAVVVMHSTRILGNAVLDALESDEFGAARDQEGVVVRDPEICGGTAFKFTGDFIVGGLASTFEEAKFRTGELIKEFEERPAGKYVIMIPGGFKPPTGGHYNMIQYYEKKPDVLKVFVVTGKKAREGVTQQQSMKIFDVYGGFSDKVDFITSSDKTPLTTCYELMKNQKFINQFPNARFSIGAGDKGGDPARIKEFVNYFAKNSQLTNAKIVEYPPAPSTLSGGQPTSASRLRKAYNDKDWETFKSLLPHESLYDDVVQVLMTGGKLEENFFTMGSLFSLVEEVLHEEKTDVTGPGQARVSKKISRLIDDEGKDPKQAAAIAYSMEERGELVSEGEDELRSDINARLLQFMLTNKEQLSGLSDEEKQDIIKDFTDDLLAQVSKGEESPEDEAKSIDPMGRGITTIPGEMQASLEETSAAGAGAAAGSPGMAIKSPWVNLENEKKRKQKARAQS